MRIGKHKKKTVNPKRILKPTEVNPIVLPAKKPAREPVPVGVPLVVPQKANTGAG